MIVIARCHAQIFVGVVTYIGAYYLLKELCHDIRAACYYFKNIWNQLQNMTNVDVICAQAQTV